MASFIVVYDANVLYPNALRDLLVRIAQLPHLVQAKWTNEILDEMSRALVETRPGITEEKTAVLRERMNGCLRAANERRALGRCHLASASAYRARGQRRLGSKGNSRLAARECVAFAHDVLRHGASHGGGNDRARCVRHRRSLVRA
jgi:hypothetical protein